MRRLLPSLLMILVLLSASFVAPAQTAAAPVAPSGPTLRALSLNGTSTFVEVADHTVLSPSAAITLEAWVYRAVGNRCEAVLGKDWTQSFWLGFCNQRVRFYVGGGAGSMTESNASVPAGTWIHIAATYNNSTGERRFYINGVLDRAVTGPAGQLAGNTLPLYIGADRTGTAPAYFFSGMLDQVRIWNRALTESEIRALLYKVTNDAPEAFSGLIGEWRFDGTLNATAFWPVSLAGTGRGTIGYETNGVVPINPNRIPLAPTAPTVDGNCSAAEYAQAERVGLRSPVGREVYVQATANDLWVCFSGLPQVVGLAASVAVDPDSSRDTNAQSDDYRFTVRQDGTTQAEQGTGGGGWAGVLPAVGAWQAAVGGPGEFVWNAEFRISRVFLGRLDQWGREPLNLALFERSLLNLPGLTPNPWPAGAGIASPATWSQGRIAATVGGPPAHQFNGQVVTPTGAGVAGATVQLLGSDGGGSGGLLAQALTDASGNFALEYRGYALDMFTVQEIDPRGAFSLGADAGALGSVVNANVIIYPGQTAVTTYGPARFVDSLERNETGAPAFDRHYLIVYSAPATISDLWPLIEAKRLQGYQVRWRSVQDINALISGRDTAEKIRNWLRTQWETYQGQPLYALLIGKTDAIPVRDVGWLGPTDYRTPGTDTYFPAVLTDWYYADLDSNWDTNNNGFYGEYLYCAPGQNRVPNPAAPNSPTACPAAGSALREGPFGPTGPTANTGDDWLAEISVGRIQLGEPGEVRRIVETMVATERSGSTKKRETTLAASLWSFEGRTWNSDIEQYIDGGSSVTEDGVTYSADGSFGAAWDAAQPYGDDSAEYVEETLKPTLMAHMTEARLLYETTAPSSDPALQPSRFTSTLPLSRDNLTSLWSTGLTGGLVTVIGHGNSAGVYHASWLRDWNANRQIEQPANPAEATACTAPPCSELSDWTTFIDSGALVDLSQSTPAPVVIANACSTGDPWIDYSGRWRGDIRQGGSNAPARIQASGQAAAWLGSLSIVPVGTLYTFHDQFAGDILGKPLCLGDATWAGLEQLIRRNRYDWRLATPMLFGDPAQSYWGNQADMRAYWPQSGRDWYGASATRASGPAYGVVLWTAAHGQPNTAALVDRDGNVLVGGRTELALVAPDGTRRRFDPLTGVAEQAPVVTTDGFAQIVGRSLRRYDSTLNLSAAANLPAAATAALRIGPDGVAWAPTESGMVRVLPSSVSETLAGGRAVTPVMFTPQGVAVWGTTSGLRTWSMDRRGAVTQRAYSGFVPTTALVGDRPNRVYFGQGAAVHAFDLDSGAALWSNTGVGGVTTAPALSLSRLYVGGSTGDVVALDRNTGVVQWRRSLGAAVQATPAVDGSRVYVAAGERLYALDTATGAVMWSVALDGPTDARSAPAIGANRTIYVTTANNRLVAVGESTLITLPSEVRVEPGLNSAVIRWRDNSSRETGFRIERCTPEGVCTVLGTAGANASSFTASVAAGAPFFVRVQAIAAGGTGAAAAAEPGAFDLPGASLSSDYAPSDLIASTLPAAPAPPTNVTAQAISAEAIRVGWSYGSATAQLLGFQIERANAAGGPFAPIAVAAPGATSFVDEGLTPGAARFYRVRAYTAGGASNYAGPANASPWPRSLPAPTRFDVAAGAGGLALSWRDNAPNETAYVVERRVPGQASFELIARLPANAQSYFDSMNLSESFFEYRVKAVAANAESPYAQNGADFGERQQQIFLPLVLR